MRVTIEGLRRWILIAAALLMAVLVGFFYYGRNRFRHIERDLPGRLGVNIQQTASGFSYTQSSQGHALFTLKASKLIQMKAGHALLHNVDITLYGPPGSGRTDHIYGSNFDYDQKDGIATSQGEVTIELQGTGGASSAGSTGETAGASTIRVRTRGLTFVQSSGEASTTQSVEFQLPRAAGTSVGADYNSRAGVVVLNSQVHITTSSNGKPAVIGAAHARLLRVSMQAFLDNATLDYQTEKGSADHATVYFRKDGTTERVDAQGHVRMATDTGATVNSATARILLDAKSQPTQTDLGGGVTFASARANETMQGSAREGTLLFAVVNGARGPQTALRHAEFRQDVHFTDAVTGLDKDPRAHAEKQLHAEKVDVIFAPPERGQSLEAQKAIALGNPLLTMRQVPSKGPSQTTRIAGDSLVATLGTQNALRQLDGVGHTRIVQESTDGSRDTSQGDVLHATFLQQPVAQRAQPQVARAEEATAVRPESGKVRVNAGVQRKKAAEQGPKMQTALETAVQDGNAVLTETPAKKAGSNTSAATLTGWAHHAEYHAANQVLHLAGSPRITDSESMEMAAETIDYQRDTQNMTAAGNVRATYTQPMPGAGRGRSAPPSMGSNGPVHVIAERAAMDHATNEAFFYGTVHTPARMWQDADSLLAPVIEIDRNRNVLKAWGENTGKQPVVDANFTLAMGANRQPSVVRVQSQTLVYSDKTRQADFHGSVTAEQGNGVIHADNALMYLKPATESSGGGQHAAANAKASATAAGGASKQGSLGQLDHLIADGHVIFTQPGRRGEGEKLVYTANDGRYVLTGTPEVRPKMWDRMHGTTTGEALILNSQDDRVEVNGGQSSAVTETRAPK